MITAYRPDPVVDPEFDGFRDNVAQLRRAHRREHARRGAAISPRTATAARSSSRWARPRPTTATRRRAPATSRAAECQRLLDRALAGTITAGRGRAVPRPDADRDGADEPRRRAGDADPPGQLPQPQSAACSRDFGRDKGADIPTPHRLRARAEAAARPLRQRARPHGDPVHARRDRLRARAGAARRATIRP